MEICCMSMCCPCIQVGKNAEGVGKDCMMYDCLWLLVEAVFGADCCISGSIRADNREQANLPDCNDYGAHAVPLPEMRAKSKTEVI